jgi:MFS transporter, MHS family, shikimate and dehydroshikimate transport protein
VTILRFIQGIAHGGEWGGAILVVIEHAPMERRGLFGGCANTGQQFGTVLSGAVVSLVLYAAGPQFLSWGWRVPFLLGLAMVAVGFYVRTRMVETPEFIALKREGRTRRMPILDVVRGHYQEILLTVGAATMSTGAFFITAIFMLSYGISTLRLGIHTVLHALIVLGVTAIASTILASGLSDRIGRSRVVIAGVAAAALYIFPFFWLVQIGTATSFTLALGLSGVMAGIIHGPTATLYTEIYDASMRYSGATLGYQIGTVLGGGLSPVVATALLKQFNGATWPICIYVLALCMLGFVCFSALGTRQRKSLAYAAAD